jgi:hypothetical protein
MSLGGACRIVWSSLGSWALIFRVREPKQSRFHALALMFGSQT